MALIHVHNHPTREPSHPASYEHMKGTEKRAHEGSQSKHPTPEFGGNAEYGTKTMHGTSVDKHDSDRGNPGGLADADE